MRHLLTLLAWGVTYCLPTYCSEKDEILLLSFGQLQEDSLQT